MFIFFLRFLKYLIFFNTCGAQLEHKRRHNFNRSLILQICLQGINILVVCNSKFRYHPTFYFLVRCLIQGVICFFCAAHKTNLIIKIYSTHLRYTIKHENIKCNH